MNLIPWKSKRRTGDGEETAPLAALRNEMDRLFETFVREPFGTMEWPFVGSGRWLPAIDIAETDQEWIVHAELPGIDPQNLEVTILGNQLFLSGEKQQASEKSGKGYYHSEIRGGAFRRSLQLPEGVDSENVEAHYDKGVLTLTLKKSPSAVPKRIEVKVQG
jgi:HSP20 family protein